MESVVLDDIPFQVDSEKLISRLRLEGGSNHADELRCLIEDAQGIARPKALYVVALISAKSDASVIIEGIRLTSRVLRVNLEHAQCVFPFVATCGVEIDAWSRSLDDVLQQYWAEAIKRVALGSATTALITHLMDRVGPGKMASMNPGSLGDWPIREQRQLFALLGDPERSIGVRLTKSYLMIPNKSVSGIRFPAEESYENCQLCPREACPGRRAPYDSDLYDRKYRPLAD